MGLTKSLVLEVLHDPGAQGITATVDVVLIHGLNGDSVKTWTHETTQVCWPRDLLPDVLPSARVLSLCYNADIHGNTSVAGIRGNAQVLLARLRDLRDEGNHDKPIVFVAHSLGGIILKQALYLAQLDRRCHALFSATRGLLLYGTPHFGADQSRWLSMAKSFAPLISRRFSMRSSHTKLVDSLTRHSPDISNICEDFRFLARRFAIVSFYETEVWPGTRAPILERMNSLMHLEHEEQVPLEANHVNLCRFRDAHDSGFMLSCRYIAQISQGIGHGPDERLVLEVWGGNGLVEW
ncbi:Alpha/Beta hydrolase protein [Parachaetomium inaequale]|uniref:Alpha/Beta hydrolase protein n=1 Tax=Parachaetomium inaequale TaxID=2588326 RepID=A0AAN6P797_9PEZI|nr:Alpha/Beta hydrolase protein [Parachaetomium inaequale]